MNEQISFIMDIQNIDLDILQFEESLKKIFNEIEELRNSIKLKESELGKLQEDLTELNKKFGTTELDIKMFDDKMIKMKDTQKLIKTNKEYNALQKSIKDTEALKKKSEQELMLLMENKESLKGKIALIQKDIEGRQGVLSLKNTEFKDMEKEFEISKNDYLKRRETTKNKIKKNYLDVYEIIKIRKGLPAVTPVLQSGACTGCYRMLPPQQFNELISENVFMQCPICSRILYIDAVLPESDHAESVPAAAGKNSKKSNNKV